MTCPRFEVAAGFAYGEGWIAFTVDEADCFGPFEWVWTGDGEVHVYAYYDDLPEEHRIILIADDHGPVIARTPEAFAAFLAGRYSTPEAIRALVEPWEAQQAHYRRQRRRHLIKIRRRAWLQRLTGRGAARLRPRRPV